MTVEKSSILCDIAINALRNGKEVFEPIVIGNPHAIMNVSAKPTFAPIFKLGSLQ